MPLKGLVRFFAIALIILSLFQLSFTWVVRNKDRQIANKVEAQMKVYDPLLKQYPEKTPQRTKVEDSLEIIREGLIAKEENKAANESVSWDPFSGSVSYQEAKGRELQLGLDLQGGMSVTMEVALDGLVKSLSNFTKDPTFNRAVELANQRKANTSTSFISLFRKAYEELAPGGKLAGFFTAKSSGELKIDNTNAQVVNYLEKSADKAFENTYEVINRRVDKFGLVQPAITKDNDKKTISLEMAGIKNPDRIKKMLQTSANLQFWEAAKYGEVAEYLLKADKAYTAGVVPVEDTSKNKTQDTTKGGNTPNFKNVLGADTGKNAGAAGTNNNNTDRRTLAGLVNLSNSMYDNKIGVIKIEDTVFFNEMLASEAYANMIPKEFNILYGKPDDDSKINKELNVYALKNNNDGKALLDGDKIKTTSPNLNEMNQPMVTLSFTNKGGQEFEDLTDRLSKGAGGIGFLAIVLDDFVYSAPSVKQKIAGGSAVISGGFKDIKEAKDLSDVINTGRYDASVKIVQDQIVGPSLGQDAVKGGGLSFLISFLVIFLLMLVYYNNSGWVANIALILNLLFTVGVLSALGATLTAPGIAGLVLTIGMAVDTNVIIFERIKEELERGRTYPAAVAEGYRRSLAPVLDAHFTTFLTAFILFNFGSGPIKGFATTQMLGIVLSLFCGILLSRLITDWYTNKSRHLNYFTPISKRIFKHANFKFIEYRKVAYIITAVVVLLGAGAILNGFDTGVEYAGGRSYIVAFDKPVSAGALREKLEPVFENKTPIVKSVNNSSRVYDITTSYLIADTRERTTVDSLVRARLYSGVKEYLNPEVTEQRFASTDYIKGSKKVEPSISEALKQGAKKAAVISILVIALYIFLRFRDWRYSVGTIIALLHDVFITLAVFSFFKGIMPFPLELDQHFIAAVLTVIGFSMNDTVIVFDRVREYAKKFKGDSKESIINRAINDTLSRTIMTSLTVFLTILILFIFGGEVTRGFAFAMLIGVVTGTYSSIFVAAPVLVDMAKDKPLGEADFLDHTSETTKAAELAAKKHAL